MIKSNNFSICYVIPLVIFLNIFPTISYGDSSQVDWASLKEAFKAYADYPSSENAMKIVNILPEQHVTYTGSSMEKEVLRFIYDRFQLDMLERQVISRDRASVKLAFKLHSIADGEFSETLDIMLGMLIRIDPLLFLEELSKAKPNIQRLDSLVGNFGTSYVDRLEADCLENQKRTKSLESITNKSLENVKTKCIQELNRFYSKYCK